MGGVVIEVEVSAGGPLLDGRGRDVIERWQRDTVRELAKDGVAELRAFPMNKTGRARGNFQSVVAGYQTGAEARIPGPQITGWTWSPWLEGNSKRNRSTRFKGYHLFRKTAQKLRDRSRRTGEDVLRRLIGELGGE